MAGRKKTAKRKPQKTRKVRKHGRKPSSKGKASKVRKLKRLSRRR